MSSADHLVHTLDFGSPPFSSLTDNRFKRSSRVQVAIGACGLLKTWESNNRVAIECK